MVNIDLLREEIRRSRKTNAQVASAIGMDESTFYRKLARDGATFTVEQAGNIAKMLELSPDKAQSIFFA